MVPIWDKYWEKADKTSSSSQGPRKDVSILSTLFYCFGAEFGLVAILCLIATLLQFASPLIVNLLIGYVQSDEPQWKVDLVYFKLNNYCTVLYSFYKYIVYKSYNSYIC